MSRRTLCPRCGRKVARSEIRHSYTTQGGVEMVERAWVHRQLDACATRHPDCTEIRTLEHDRAQGAWGRAA